MQAFLQSLLLFFSALLWTFFSSFVLANVAQGASIGINSSICGSPDDPCMNQRSWNQCKKFESSGCQQILVAQSCPVQFGCGDSSNATSPPVGSANEANSTSTCGSPNDACMNKENWNVCNNLVQSGCQTILVGESCPVQFACGDSGGSSSSSSSGKTTQPKRQHVAGAGKPRGSKPATPGALKKAKKRQHQPGDKRPKE